MIKIMNNIDFTCVEEVDSNEELTVKCANIKSLFEPYSPKKNEDIVQWWTDNCLFEDKLRRIRGTIIDNRTKAVVQEGGFFPYEYTHNLMDKCIAKMADLNHDFKDMKIGYSWEGTIIRIFYHNKWYVSTHRKLDAGRSKWGSNNSFKFLFEEGLKESYNISLQDLFGRLNLRCQYTFILMADKNTRFVCTTDHNKKVYFIGSNDPECNVGIEGLPEISGRFDTIESVFKFVETMTYPFTFQGILMVHPSGSQYRIISEEYATYFKVRNNEQSIPYRYLQLKSQNDHVSLDLLVKLFPDHIPVFEQNERYISKLVEIILVEYNKRKQRSLLPRDLTTVEQIDQKLYLFIKTKLLKIKDQVTSEKILELLWQEEPSNLNQMIRMVRFNETKQQKNLQKLVVDIDKVTITNVAENEKRKRPKYTKIPIEFSRIKMF